jgi:glutamate/tyrosine decarboxylase-like PLP-dependent enzyme
MAGSCIAGLTSWQSPRFFAWFSANSSTAGLLGDMLGAAFNVIGFTWGASPACTELEMVETTEKHCVQARIGWYCITDSLLS